MTRDSRSKVSDAAQRADTPYDARHEHPGSERRLADESVVLIVNAGGAVQFCSNGAAQLFDGRSDEMLGRPINSLIPDLPLQDVTPGYNVAYTCFWSSQDDWHRLHRSVPGGQAAPVEFTLKAAQRQQDEPYALVVRLRSAAD
jgi:PAS domain-containing protein